MFSPVNSGQHLIGDISGSEQSNDLVEGVKFLLELIHVSFVVGNIGIPSGNFLIEVGLSGVSVDSSSVSEFFLVGDLGVDNLEGSIVGLKSGLSLLNGVVADSEESLEGLDFLSVDSIGLSSGVHKVLEELVQEIKDLLGGRSVSEFLGELDESLGKMSDGGDTLKGGVELLEVSLSLFDFGERSSVLETLNEGNALSDGIFGTIVVDDELLVGSLGLVSLSGGLLDGTFSVSNEFLVHSDELLESGSLWVEGVLEMGRSDTESDLGVSESLVDLVLNLEVLGFGPSVFFLFTTEFKVKVFNKVLEGSHKLVHWSASGKLKLHKIDSDSTPTGFLESFDFVLKREFSGGFDLHSLAKSKGKSEYGNKFHGYLRFLANLVSCYYNWV